MYRNRASALIVASMMTTTAWAQEARGTLVGKLLDPSGAAIPAATISVSNKAMGTSQNVVTNEVGFYQATYLIPGFYRVEVTLP